MDKLVSTRRDSVLQPGEKTISRTPTPEPPECETSTNIRSRTSSPGPFFKDASGNIGTRSTHYEFVELDVMNDFMEDVDPTWKTFNKICPSDDQLDKHNRGSVSMLTTSNSSTDTDESGNAVESNSKGGNPAVDAQANTKTNNKGAEQDGNGNITMADADAEQDGNGNITMADADAEQDPKTNQNDQVLEQDVEGDIPMSDADKQQDAMELNGSGEKSNVRAQAKASENDKDDGQAVEDDEPMADSEENQEPVDIPEDDEFYKRQLRPQTRNNTNFLTTWLDTDKSENYDPVEDERQQRLKKRRARLPKRRPKSDEDETTSEDAPRERPPPLERPKLILSLTFGTDEGKQEFKKLITTFEAVEQAEIAGYRLRTRAKDVLNDECRTEDHVKSSHDDIDLTAKPFARGCWGCVHLAGKDGEPTCSLVHDERDWPCEACRGDNHDCELIIPPDHKRACEFCKRRRLQCSYRTTRNHGDTCKQCADVGYRCIAGPVKDLIRPRIRLDRDWENDPLPKKKKTQPPKDCLECRQVGGKCIYIRADGSPCEDCKYAGLPCTIAPDELPESSPPTGDYDFDTFLEQTAKAARQAAQPQPPAPPPRRPKPPMTTNPGDEGSVQYISTSFSHPVKFNCDSSSNSSDQPCHFHTCPSFAFIGCGLKPSVRVLTSPAEAGFTEISDGHAADGVENLRLCVQCTSDRMSILLCDRHEMRPIPGVYVTPEISAEAVNALHDETLMSLEGFCALCQSLASYECIAAQQDDGGEGCGMKLCEGCALQLEGQSDGSLKDLLLKLESGVIEAGELLRADVEFLKKDGALAKYLRWMGEQQ